MIIAIFWVSTDIKKADKASRTIDLKEEISQCLKINADLKKNKWKMT